MSEEGEAPVVQVEGELLPAKKKLGRPATGRKGPQKFRSGVAAPPYKRIGWLNSARVLDLESYARLREAKLGAKKIAKALGTVMATAQRLMSGTHWQQDPEKVRTFNRVKGASIDPETGIPTAQDLAKFGHYEHVTRHTSEGDKDLKEIVERAGVSKPMLDEAVRRLRILSGAADEGDLPAKIDTKWLQDKIDQNLGTIMTLMDPVTMAGASVADLTRAASMLFEKRALLRGEPTAIVRNEQRGGLDTVARLLLAEVERRGITLDMPKTEYREVPGG